MFKDGHTLQLIKQFSQELSKSRGYFYFWESDCRSQIKHFHLHTPKWYSQTHCQMWGTVQLLMSQKKSVSIWEVISIFIYDVFSKLFLGLGSILTVGIAPTNEWGGFPWLINGKTKLTMKTVYMYDVISKDRTLV